jgi:hypothetical protein
VGGGLCDYRDEPPGQWPVRSIDGTIAISFDLLARR